MGLGSSTALQCRLAKIWGTILIGGALLSLTPGVAQAQVSKMAAQQKAIYIRNILSFVHWPRRLQNSVRSYDMVGRFGGEEFLVILNRCDPARALARAENIRDVVARKPFLTRSKPLEVTISIGLALSSDFEEHTVDEILLGVDEALYEAKRAGRNCVRGASVPKTVEGKGTRQGETASLTNS